MLFQKRFWEPIRDGTMTLTFRRWKRRQVIAGNRYRTGAGIVEVTDVNVVSSITDKDAQAAGHPSAAALMEDLPGDEDQPIYRIRFRYVDEPDPRQVLAEDDQLDADAIAEIDRRLDRLDRAPKPGPWTRQYLHTIADHPHRRAPDLAAMYGRETQPFKTDVRKLKNLGLTLSFNPGYTLSPRGEAYLQAIDARPR